MVDIDSKRLELYFEQKLLNSLAPFLRYSRSFSGNFQKLVFRVFDPVKWEFFVETDKIGCTFKLSFQRVVSRPSK